MPVKKSFKRKTRKFVRKSAPRRMARRRFAKPSLLRLKSASVVPDRMLTKMTHHESVNMTVVSVRAVQVYRGNSCFDPDLTGAGHQPLGFDQWSAFYNKYRVTGSKIVVKVASYEATEPLFVLVLPMNDNLSPTTDEAYEYPNVKSKILTGTAAKGTVTLSSYMSTARMKGIKSIQYSEQYSALVSTNPAQEWYWRVIVGSVDRIGFPAAIMEVSLTYYVEMFDRNNLSAS